MVGVEDAVVGGVDAGVERAEVVRGVAPGVGGVGKPESRADEPAPVDPVDVTDVVDPVDAADPDGPADAVDTVDSVDAVDPDDAADAVDTADSGDTAPVSGAAVHPASTTASAKATPGRSLVVRRPPEQSTPAAAPRAARERGRPRPRRNMRPIVPVAGLTATLAVPGVLHFAHPAPFVAIVPRSLPRPELLVALSGVAELACAALVASPRTRRAGGLAAAALFAAVFPANVSMALRSRRRPRWYRVVAWARLPLQIPLVGWALRVSKL
jgi:uncharacterized membrane protein